MNYIEFLKSGQKIKIKKENRGKFTESANRANMGVQEYARHILANKEDYSPTLIKRANFARNAAKWNAFGGDLNTYGGTYNGGLEYINNGHSHSENPYGGVPMGSDKDGIPNLVEENEGVNIILKQSSRTIKKDKFSAFEYGLYYIKQEEDRSKRHKKRNVSEMMFFTS